MRAERSRNRGEAVAVIVGRLGSRRGGARHAIGSAVDERSGRRHGVVIDRRGFNLDAHGG